jgi:hypothetical protein
MERIDRGRIGDEARFDPLPYWLNPAVRPDFRLSGQVTGLLEIAREWLLAEDTSVNRIVYGAKLYAAIAGAFDSVVLSDLDNWIKSGDLRKLTVVARILREAHPSFVFESIPFVIDLLDRCTVVGKDCAEMMVGSLWASAASGIRQGSPGPPFPEDTARRTGAEQALARLPRGSSAWELYNSLKRSSEADINWKRDRDEELFEE